MMIIGLFVAANVQYMTHNKKNKARRKKSYLVVKMTISICLNKKFLRVKSTTKQENNRTLKRTVFIFYVFTP